MGICEDRVCIVTGGGRGIGREHALLLARHGARVVVNDLGTGPDGNGRSAGPAQDVVDEIVGFGGEAVANTDDVADTKAANRLIQQAVETFGALHVLVNNAGILRDRMLTNMTDEEWDAVVTVNLPRHVRPQPGRGGLLARAGEGRRPRRRPADQHQLSFRHLLQRRAGELRGSQGRRGRPDRDRRS